jgi:hypothetical protein
MTNQSLRDLDPLDLEMIERAFDGVWAAIKQKGTILETETEKSLKTMLRRELVKIARLDDASDADALCDIALATVVAATNAR